MFSDPAGTVPVLTSDMIDGFAFTVDMNLDGSTTVTNYSAQTGVSPQTSAVPEPGSLVLLGIGMTLLLGVSRLRRSVWMLKPLDR
jgi:hypothetical protein